MLKKTPSKESLFSNCSEAPTTETFSIGEVVKAGDRTGRVAFIGRTQFQPGDWIGVILDTPDGKNNGTVNGIKYFECKDKHGLFCRPGKLVKLLLFHQQSPSRGARSPTAGGARSPTTSVRSMALSVAASNAGGTKEHSPYAGQFGYDIGDRVVLGDGRGGKVKFLNPVGDQVYAGIVFDRPVGDSDGKFRDLQYFKCYPKYATFVPAGEVKRAAMTTASSALPPRNAPRQTKASQLRLEKGGAVPGTTLAGGVPFHGSRESLDSLTSARLRSPPPNAILKGSPTKPPNAVRDAEIVVSLKKCLQEKEAHLAQLSNELSERTSDADRLMQENMSLRLRVGELDTELTAARRECQNLQHVVDERDKRLDDLSFCFTEAELQKEELEQRLREVRAGAMEPLVELDEEEEKMKASVTFQDAGVQTDEAPPAEKRPAQRPAWTQTDVVRPESVNSGVQTEQQLPTEVACSGMQTDQPALNDSGAQTELQLPAEVACSGTQTDQPTLPAEVACSGTQTDQRVLNHSGAQTEQQLPAEVACSGTQTDQPEQQLPAEMACSGTQTDQPALNDSGIQASYELSSGACQTDELPARPLTSSGVQTDQSQVVGIDAEIQASSEVSSGACQTDGLPARPLTSSGIQTDQPALNDYGIQASSEVSSGACQTDELPARPLTSSGIQTDQAVGIDAGIQTSCEASPGHSSKIDKDINTSGVLELNVAKLPQDAELDQISPSLQLERREMEQLRQAYEFQQSIIAEQLNEIKRLKQQQQLQNGFGDERSPTAAGSTIITISATSPPPPTTTLVSGGMATVSTRAARAQPRTYCDHCELFDAHDTRECPKEEARQAERHAHATLSPAKRQ